MPRRRRTVLESPFCRNERIQDLALHFMEKSGIPTLTEESRYGNNLQGESL
jgi:hypothetical protein